jgi:CheY-like chemotaxis protein
MVHGLALQLGGALSIKSRPGLGTTIDLYLPQTSAVPVKSQPAAAQAPAAASAGTVLLVDDELAVRESTAEMLRDLGFEVTEAGDVSEALRVLEDWQPDFVVTDHLMPGITGTELAAMIRKRHPKVVTLLVSGYAQIDDISPDLPRLTKPFRQHELASKLASLR